MIFSIDFYSTKHNTFGWLSERGGNIFNLLQKEGVPRKGGGVPLEKGGFKPGENYEIVVIARD